jgi:hypothetical protein
MIEVSYGHSGQNQVKEEVQSGKQVAFGVVAFIIGTIVLLFLLKYLTGS